jgi:hypothetical protein
MPGQGHRIEGTMSHDKISAATRTSMAEAGEHIPSPTAKWFAISYSDAWAGRLADSVDRLLFRARHGISGVEVDDAKIRVQMGCFRLDIPRGSVRSVRRSPAVAGSKTGVHGRRGWWLVNGSAEGLTELVIDPPGRVSRGVDTLFGLGPSRVAQLTISLDDPEGFIEAVEGNGSAH